MASTVYRADYDPATREFSVTTRSQTSLVRLPHMTGNVELRVTKEGGFSNGDVRHALQAIAASLGYQL